MVIGCLGWGSLIWDPRSLEIRKSWFSDGPLCPVEFLRQSNDGRITLVVAPGFAPVRLLWSIMSVTDVDRAIESLRVREQISAPHAAKSIGRWNLGDPAPPNISDLDKWAVSMQLDAVIWTSLGPRFQGRRHAPSVEQVVSYLDSLTGLARDEARRYVEFAPPQIDTGYRRIIGQRLGWCPRSFS